MIKHTLGPWIAGDDEDSDYYLVGPHVDGLVSRPVVKLHCEADAFLIAAAPELLAAITALTSMAESFPNELHADHPDVVSARAAIEKATGGAA